MFLTKMRNKILTLRILSFSRPLSTTCDNWSVSKFSAFVLVSMNPKISHYIASSEANSSSNVWTLQAQIFNVVFLKLVTPGFLALSAKLIAMGLEDHCYLWLAWVFGINCHACYCVLAGFSVGVSSRSLWSKSPTLRQELGSRWEWTPLACG